MIPRACACSGSASTCAWVTPSSAGAHRDLWIRRAQEMLKALQLPAEAVVANDPFFGRGGRMLAASQREQALKFELVVPITSVDHPTACASCNHHQDTFERAFEIRDARGSLAHSACVGFGLERIVLALFKPTESPWTGGRCPFAPR